MAEWWSVDLLDRADRKKATLPRVRGGSLDWSTFRAVSGAGSIELTDQPEVDVDWLNDRFRVWWHRDGEARSMGVYLGQIPGWTQAGPVRQTTITLADKTEVLNSPIGQWLTYPVGTGVVGQVAALIRARGEMSIQVEPSTETLRTALTWEPETTWLSVVNDLLGAINYGSLWCDALGTYRLEPYVAPEARPIVATYGGGVERLRMLGGWSDEADLASLPTGFRVYVAGDDSTPGLIGKADLPDEHPLSAASRGRAILTTESGEATSQAIANEIANRRLQESLQVTRRATIIHPIDDVALNDVVAHGPLGFSGAVVQREIRLDIGAVVTDTVRRIYTGGDLPWQ